MRCGCCSSWLLSDWVAVKLTGAALRRRQAGVKGGHARVKCPISCHGGAYACRVLRIRLLGRMVVEHDESELSAPAARRAWSLLAYLALHPGPQPRAEL